MPPRVADTYTNRRKGTYWEVADRARVRLHYSKADAAAAAARAGEPVPCHSSLTSVCVGETADEDRYLSRLYYLN